MNLYLIRHAHADNAEEWAGDDAERPLTPLGHQQSQALGQAFRDRRLAVDVVLTSPLVRTRQTAADFQNTIAPGGPEPQPSNLLAPGAMRRRKLTKLLAGLEARSVAVVGHNPDLSEYLIWLLAAGAEQVHLAKGAAAFVHFEDGPEKGEGVLNWIVTPDWYLPVSPDSLVIL